MKSEEMDEQMDIKILEHEQKSLPQHSVQYNWTKNNMKLLKNA
jgi:hypothetical protein